MWLRPDRKHSAQNSTIFVQVVFSDFQTALKKGFFPSYWKISKVIPIFRDENRAMIEQYRSKKNFYEADKNSMKNLFVMNCMIL